MKRIEGRRDRRTRKERAMKVRDIMTSEPSSCTPGDPVSLAAERMWEADCGLLPVVEEGRVVGVVTDRDICMGTALQAKDPRQVRVGEVCSQAVHACGLDDEVGDALEVMSEHQVRRLPVLDGDALVGVLSLNDAVLEARPTAGKEKSPTHKQVMATLQAVSAHRGLPASS
jgi:CBS domain-containing protein